MEGKKKARRVPPIPDPSIHPFKYRWLLFRWRLSVATVVYPMQMSVAVAIVICAIPLYLVIGYQHQLKDQQQQLKHQQDVTNKLAKDNADAIKRLRLLTLRVTTIEKPTVKQLREGIALALRRCSRDPKCSRSFARFQSQLQRRAAAGPRTTAPHRHSPGRTSSPHSPPVPNPPDHPSTPPPSTPPSGGGGNSGGGGGGGGQPPPQPRPQPPVHVTVPPVPGLPVQPPSVCTPVIAVNCP